MLYYAISNLLQFVKLKLGAYNISTENTLPKLREIKSFVQLYARYLCSRDALGLKAKRARDDRVSCIQSNLMQCIKNQYMHLYKSLEIILKRITSSKTLLSYFSVQSIISCVAFVEVPRN